MAKPRYQPDRSGIRDLGRETAVGDACLDAARRIAAWAGQQDPKGSYVARPASLPAGYSNELRRGAVVEETRQGEGAEKRTLARSVNEVQ